MLCSYGTCILAPALVTTNTVYNFGVFPDVVILLFCNHDHTLTSRGLGQQYAMSGNFVPTTQSFVPDNVSLDQLGALLNRQHLEFKRPA